MRLMPDKSPRCSEFEMQDQVSDYFAKRVFRNPNEWNKPIIPKIYREVNIPEIGRISDIIIYLTDRRIINIECKLVDYGTVVSQSMDHLRWADYSYVCLFADTYLPAYILDKMIVNGIGLIFWTPEFLVEVIQSGYNKKKDKTIRESVMKKLKKQDQKHTGQRELGGQIIAFNGTVD
jgi:hypothetical protein